LRFGITTKKVIKVTLQKSKISEKQIAAIGITNQRETTVIWNKKLENHIIMLLAEM